MHLQPVHHLPQKYYSLFYMIFQQLPKPPQINYHKPIIGQYYIKFWNKLVQELNYVTQESILLSLSKLLRLLLAFINQGKDLLYAPI